MISFTQSCSISSPFKALHKGLPQRSWTRRQAVTTMIFLDQSKDKRETKKTEVRGSES